LLEFHRVLAVNVQCYITSKTLFLFIFINPSEVKFSLAKIFPLLILFLAPFLTFNHQKFQIYPRLFWSSILLDQKHLTSF